MKLRLFFIIFLLCKFQLSNAQNFNSSFHSCAAKYNSVSSEAICETYHEVKDFLCQATLVEIMDRRNVKLFPRSSCQGVVANSQFIAQNSFPNNQGSTGALTKFNRSDIATNKSFSSCLAQYSNVSSAEICESYHAVSDLLCQSAMVEIMDRRNAKLFPKSACQGNAYSTVTQASALDITRADRERLLTEQKFKEQQRIAMETSEISRLRADAEQAKRKQIELEEQLRQAQQSVSIPSQAASIGVVGRRIALVVGNANYKVRPLKNPRNDADDVSRSLKATGFEVIDLRDATLPQMRTAVRQFGDRLINNDVGLVYYSGHGVEVKGRNYFIPVNADIQREDEIADQGLDVSLILEKMSTAGKGVNILIVDACRDDPFGRSFRSSSRGLANMDAPRGTIIAYATSPGKVASDGDPRERNSPYTKHLVKAMQSPNKPIEQVFKEVRRAVQDETKNQQTPWENTSLSGDFFFRVQR
jgi:hypothetical protein